MMYKIAKTIKYVTGLVAASPPISVNRIASVTAAITAPERTFVIVSIVRIEQATRYENHEIRTNHCIEEVMAECTAGICHT